MGMATMKGGNKFEKVLRDARRAGNTSVSVGVQQGERYPDGTSVAEVAAAHEFGLSKFEIPYFRRAMIEVRAILKTGRYRGLARGGLTSADAATVGALAVERIKKSIADAGLIDTGRLIRSISFTVLTGKVRAADDDA